MFPKAVHTR